MTEQSQSPDAEPYDAEVTDLTQHRRRAESGRRLSAASAASVREAAIAVLSRGVRYLPVVEDGTLVGLVALARAPRARWVGEERDCGMDGPPLRAPGRIVSSAMDS
jgi:hypothetical protein